MQKPLWRWGGALALALTAFCGAAPGVSWAQGAQDPETALKELNAWYQDAFTKERAKQQPDFRALATERQNRARAAVKDLDPEKVDPAKALAAAQLFQAANDNPKMVAAAKRFLTGNPDGQPRYNAQNLLLSGYAATGDAEGIIGVIGEIKPPTPQTAAMVATMTGARYAEIVADKKGAQAALDLLTKAEALVPFSEMLAKPDVDLPAQGNQPARKGPAPEKSAAEQAIVYLAMARADVLDKQGKKEAAVAALETAQGKLSAGSPAGRQLEGKIKLAKIVGTPAPDLKQDRGYNGFKSINDYKGKVVVVEFTAHW